MWIEESLHQDNHIPKLLDPYLIFTFQNRESTFQPPLGCLVVLLLWVSFDHPIERQPGVREIISLLRSAKFDQAIECFPFLISKNLKMSDKTLTKKSPDAPGPSNENVPR